MKWSWQRLVVMVTLVFAASVLAVNPVVAASKKTLTGEVGDAMCGNKHMEGSPTECTRTCVSKGSKYALVVGEKVYVLETSDKAVLAVLDKQAGQKATVTGNVEGDKIEVSSAVAAK